jgi:hypothetical protein
LFEERIFVVPCKSPTNQVLKELTKLSSNYYLDVNIGKTRLPYRDSRVEEMFRDCVRRLFQEPEKRVYPELQREIRPIAENPASQKAIICDLCQKGPAIHEYSHEDTSEYLCKDCYELRKSSPRYQQLAEWEEAGNLKIALIDISLNYGLLLTAISACFNREFRAKLDEKKIDSVRAEDFGFSIVFEFLEDYQKFLEEFAEEINGMQSIRGKSSGVGMFEILKNLYVLRIGNERNLILLIEKYGDLYRRYFRKFIELRISPIYLSLSCSGIKHPFLEHWRALEHYKTKRKRFTIYLHIAGKGSIETEIWNSEGLVTLYKAVSRRGVARSMHKLAEIAKFSETFADKIMYESERGRGDDVDYKAYKQLMDPGRPHGLDYKSLLTLVKIIGGNP